MRRARVINNEFVQSNECEGGESEHDGGRACVACGAFIHGFRADEPCTGKRPPPPTVEEARTTFERAMADERARRLPVPSVSDGVHTPEDAIAWLAADPARREAFNALHIVPDAVDKNVLRQMVRDLRWQEESDDDIHAALFAAGRASRDEEVAQLRTEMARMDSTIAVDVRDMLALRADVARLIRERDEILAERNDFVRRLRSERGNGDPGVGA